MLISIIEKAIAKKGIKESDPFDWEKTPGDASQATTTTSTPPMGQIYTTPVDNKCSRFCLVTQRSSPTNAKNKAK